MQANLPVKVVRLGDAGENIKLRDGSEYVNWKLGINMSLMRKIPRSRIVLWKLALAHF